MFANLAYSKFSTVREKELSIHDVILDPLSFNHLNSIFEDRYSFFTEDENFLWEFIQENKDKPQKYIAFKDLSADIQEIITHSRIPLKKGWIEDDKYKDIHYASIDPNFPYQPSIDAYEDYKLFRGYSSAYLPIQDRTNLLVKSLQVLKEKKIKENRNILEQIK